MHICKKSKKGAFTNSVDPDETPRFELFVMLSKILVTVDKTKSYINQELFHFVNGC